MTSTSDSDDSEVKHDESSSIYLIAGRMDAQSRLLAKRLHELGYIYALYGALDGLSLSYSMIKYAFDMLNKVGSSSDAMHEWMLTPEGIVLTASSSLTLIVFAMLANHYKDDDKNQLKAFIATVWPYCRDVMKGLKNAYKGFRSTIQLMELLGGSQNLHHLIVPVGLLLGCLSAVNRLWFRYYVNQRKDMMRANAVLLSEIQAAKTLTLTEIQKKHEEIQGQSEALRRKMLLSATYGGIVDGLYLYIGVLTLCSLSPAVLTAMTVFCAIYFLACIATRVYEEHDFQRRLLVARAKIELALCGKELQEYFLQLHGLSQEIALSGGNEERRLKQKELMSKLASVYDNFEKKRNYLRELSTLSYSSAFLAGLRNGLAAYGALASALFAIATVLVLSSASFPPALLITSSTLGMVLLLGFTIHAMLHAHWHQLKQEETSKLADKRIDGLLKIFSDAKKDVNSLQPEEIRTAITDRMVVDPSPQFFFQEAFEVVRSLCSGLGKGSKAVDFALNPLQERGADGHYHDTPVMLWVTVISALVHAVVLALRAHARGFGRAPLDAVRTVKVEATGDQLTTTSLSGESEHMSKLSGSPSRVNETALRPSPITPKETTSIVSDQESNKQHQKRLYRSAIIHSIFGQRPKLSHSQSALDIRELGKGKSTLTGTNLSNAIKLPSPPTDTKLTPSVPQYW
ncbi:transmembrane protein [Legionella lansingensis]|uniref:Transmembrane protein n=1 Tax=Legionella lansingensis TaxID=45067 RepID=A0A0W0VRF7_9GAMM|nr:hypothetical protein [Legionella lansingensis]KTD22779.1 transmembrane protein [Legionella lansingensis]SNV57163.1 transmembrane protein [Legionella lansingensis]